MKTRAFSRMFAGFWLLAILFLVASWLVQRGSGAYVLGSYLSALAALTVGVVDVIRDVRQSSQGRSE